jgi:hypothetical protein
MLHQFQSHPVTLIYTNNNWMTKSNDLSFTFCDLEVGVYVTKKLQFNHPDPYMSKNS